MLDALGERNHEWIQELGARSIVTGRRLVEDMHPSAVLVYEGIEAARDRMTLCSSARELRHEVLTDVGSFISDRHVGREGDEDKRENNDESTCRHELLHETDR